MIATTTMRYDELPQYESASSESERISFRDMVIQAFYQAPNLICSFLITVVLGALFMVLIVDVTTPELITPENPSTSSLCVPLGPNFARAYRPCVVPVTFPTLYIPSPNSLPMLLCTLIPLFSTLPILFALILRLEWDERNMGWWGRKHDIAAGCWLGAITCAAVYVGAVTMVNYPPVAVAARSGLGEAVRMGMW